jgi:imidazoleglycerol phosphate synthase glutamine amidotransferase subunit HisH
VRVAICRYGAGNVRSVELALGRLGAELVDDVESADLAVLPGVGSARSAMEGLKERGTDAVLRERHAAGRPILGICLGLQLALDESEEDGGVPGLGLVPGRAVRLHSERVPRIGWATVEPVGSGLRERSGLRKRSWSRPEPTGVSDLGLRPGGEAFWFAHSYVAETEATVATSEGLAAIVEHGSFTGVQFHPEKSGAAGARFLERCLSRA